MDRVLPRTANAIIPLERNTGPKTGTYLKKAGRYVTTAPLYLATIQYRVAFKHKARVH